MKLYVIKNRRKVYLKTTARTRLELFRKIGKRYFYLGRTRFSINDVKAEKDSSDTGTGVVIGGIIGLVGGPIGLIAGGFIGGLIGNSNEVQEEKTSVTFNESKV